MKKIIFLLIFIFAFSSWSWSRVSLQLIADDYSAEYKIEPFLPGGKLMGTLVAQTQKNGTCAGNFVLSDDGELYAFFNGPDGIGSVGGCADENIVITIGKEARDFLNEGEINTTRLVRWEAYFFEDDLARNGQITLLDRV